MADADWAKYRQLRGKALPPVFTFRGRTYEQETLFKRDFYAATGLYRRVEGARGAVAVGDSPARVLLKIYHTDPFLFVPLDWLGRWLCRREAFFLETLAGIPGIPRLFARHGDSGLVREYVPGVNLRQFQQAAVLDAEFFPRLLSILGAVHERGLSHNDLHKPENILVRPDGSPVLIDFQIATSFRTRWPFAKQTMRYMQAMDRYHVMKHYVRLRPDDVSAEQRDVARRKGVLLNLHGWLLRRPYRAVRHFVMNRFLKAPVPAAPAAMVAAEAPHARAA
jgi:hypothetical protein